MDVKVLTDKVISYLKAGQKYLPVIVAAVIVITFAILTYFALYPSGDSALVAEGEARVQSLNIRFNTKLLNELETTKTPTQLGTSGGRDPFSGF